MNKHGGYYGKNKDNVIDFSVNINPLGVSERVIKRINERINGVVRYPEIDGISTKEIIAKNLGIDKEQIILGNGAIELIYLFSRSVKSERVLIIQPTFNEYERAFRISGSQVFNYILSNQQGFVVDSSKLLDKIKEVKPDVVVFCNPNNPTGMYTDYEKLKEVFNYIREVDSCIFIDESFIEFTDRRTAIYLVKQYPVFILRSMTKFYSIPGIRLGYSVANEEITEKLNLYKEPWTVNSIALDVAPVLFEDKEYIEKTKNWLNKEKSFMKAELDKIEDILVYKSYTNFHLCEIKNQKASELKEKLLKHDIYIRT